MKLEPQKQVKRRFSFSKWQLPAFRLPFFKLPALHLPLLNLPKPAMPVAVQPALNAFRRMAKGMWSTTLTKSSSRLRVVMVCFGALYFVLAGRMIHLGMNPDEPTPFRKAVMDTMGTARPTVVDRNGELMASDVKLFSVYIEPRKLIDLDDAVELITGVFPDIDHRELRKRLAKRTGFEWIKRKITPIQMAQVYHLGLPGIGFMPEYQRVYPNGSVASHVLGFANKDNEGIAGIEKYIDSSGLNDLKGLGFAATRSADLKPVELSIDLRVNYAMRDELQKSMEKFKAKAAAGAIVNVNTGELIAHVSLPDYDPNTPVDALNNNNIDRIAVGRYEMGSTFKALTTAMALDSGKVGMNTMFDARNTLTYGRFRIHDSHGTGRSLTVPEIFMHSSNIGTARMALSIGVEGHKAFLRKMGQLDIMRTELPEAAAPIVPKNWGELNTMTISFGHGLAVTPLQASMAVAALVNGGIFLSPTVLKRNEAEAAKLGRRVIKAETSEDLRYVLRLNAERGTATRANIPGYFVGAKTGTAEKVIGRSYSKDKVLTTFMAVMPADKPKYLFLIMLDEPKGLPETHNFITSGWNAAPVTGNIIERVGPMLDVTPRFDPPTQPFPYVARLGLKVPQ